MAFDFKKFRIDILIVVGFAVLSLMYCYPQLQGKKLRQSDNVSWKAMSREAMAFHDSTGMDVLWSNSMFGGMPSYTAYVGAANTNYVGYVQPFLQSVGKPAYFFFIAMLCFYILMRVLGINKWLAIVGSIAYAFSTYNPIIIAVGHETKMLTIGYLPAAMAGIFLIYKGNWLPGSALFGISMALIAGNNHYQVMYYFFIILLCFAIGMFAIAIKEGTVKKFFISSAIAAVTFAIGIGPAITSVLTTTEYSKETMRGGGSELSGHDKKTNGGLDKEYAFRWSNGIGETFCLMIPYLYGGASHETGDKAPEASQAYGEVVPLYWGPQPAISGPVFFGAIVCFLFVLGLLVVQSPHKWWIAIAAFIGIMMSWGKNFEAVNFFLFDHLPMLNKFRTPSMAMVIAQFLFPVLGIWAVQEIINQKDKPERLLKQLKIAAGITAGLCILVGVGSSLFFDFVGMNDPKNNADVAKALHDDRAALAVSSGLKSAVLILMAAGLLWAFIKDKLKIPVLITGLGILVAADLLPVAYNYLNGKEHEHSQLDNYVDASVYDAEFAPRKVDEQILRDPDPYYRVFDLSTDPFNDATPSYFHKCVGGYHPAKMEIYQDLIERHIGNLNHAVLNMLNTKYIIVGGQGRQEGVIPNPSACGNAWFVDEIKWANTADEEMDGLKAPSIQDTAEVPGSFDPRKTAVMRATFKNEIGSTPIGKDSSAFIKLTRYGLDDLSFTSQNSKDGLGVFSDIYYSKGWKAYVDGKETPIMRVNYVLRAIKIPAGNHKIEFHFKPASFYLGQKIAMVSSILLILICLAALYPLFKKDTAVAEQK